MGGQVVGQLAMPVDERRPQRRTGNRGVDLVAHPVPPPGASENSWVCRHQPITRGGGIAARRRQRVDEPVRRVEAVPIVLGDPAQPPGSRAPPAVGQRLGLRHHRHRLPRRNQARHGARPGVPGEHLGQRMVDDAFTSMPMVPFGRIKLISVIRSRCAADCPSYAK